MGLWGQLQLPAFYCLLDTEMGRGSYHEAPDEMPECNGFSDGKNHVYDEEYSEQWVQPVVHEFYLAFDRLLVLLG